MRQSETNDKRMTFRNELQEMISRGILCAMQAGEKKARNAAPREVRDRVERLLYAREGLGILISSLEEELLLLPEEGPPSVMAYEKTENKVVHLLPSGAALGMPHRRADVEALLTRNRLAAKRIDRAVTSLSGDPYFEILHLKYTEGRSEEEIAEMLSCDPSTVRRNKNRLLERLSVLFFGIDALESA